MLGYTIFFFEVTSFTNWTFYD